MSYWSEKLGYAVLASLFRKCVMIILRLPALQRAVLRFFPDDFLNDANIGLSGARFTHAECLPWKLALMHLHGYEPARKKLQHEYWVGVENGLISCDAPHQRNKGGFYGDWYSDLVRNWVSLKELLPLDIDGAECLRRIELQGAFKRRSIPWPPTWR